MRMLRFRKKVDIHKRHIQIFILLGLITLAVIFIRYNRLLDKIYSSQSTNFGISYSPDYATQLGLDPRQTYTEILGQLNVKLIRLSAYWDKIEPEPGIYDFQELDYYLNETSTHNAKVILAVGFKLPRWPECRAPQWLNTKNQTALRQARMQMVEAVITNYRNHPAVYAWQVENEPLFPFGVCPPPDKKLLQEEVSLVRSLSDKPVILTDAGELSLWNSSMALSDYFGTTLYRVVFDAHFGELPYPLQPWYYRIKSDVIRKLFAPNNQKTIISELQGEPWAVEPILNLPIQEQIKRLSPQQLTANVEFARRVGFDEIYLWGVEWWYWMKVQGHPQYWEYVQSLF